MERKLIFRLAAVNSKSVKLCGLLACALLVSGCAGPTLKPATQDFAAGNVLVNDTFAFNGTRFRAVDGKIEFAGQASPVGKGAAMFLVRHDRDPLASGDFVPVYVFFKPTRDGDFSAAYTPLLLAGAPDGFPLNLSGVGVAYFEKPQATAKGGAMPDGQNFRAICIGTSDKWTYVITNTLAVPVELTTTMLGADSPPITVSPDRFTVPASGTANVEVTFAPTEQRLYSATLIVRTGSPAYERLQGIWIHGRGKLC